MIEKEEIIDEIDWKGNLIKNRKIGDLEKDNFVHKVAIVIPTTNDGKIILSKRAKNKHPWPNTWVCAVGGKVSSGETPIDAALREMKEETDTILPLKEISIFNYNDSNYKAIFHLFTTKYPTSSDKFKPNPEEVQYLKEFSVQEVKEMILRSPNEFAPTFISAFNCYVKNHKF